MVRQRSQGPLGTLEKQFSPLHGAATAPLNALCGSHLAGWLLVSGRREERATAHCAHERLI